MLSQNSQLRSAFNSCNTISYNMHSQEMTSNVKAFRQTRIEAPKMEACEQNTQQQTVSFINTFRFPRIDNSINPVSLSEKFGKNSLMNKVIPIKVLKSNRDEDDDSQEMMPPSPRTPAAK